VSLYRPPAPIPTTPNKGLLRAIFRGERDLIGMLPDHAYRDRLGELGKSRRGILIVSAPELVQKILIDAEGIFPKNDLMVGALEGLVGQSIFVSSGAAWRRQRRMVDPAFSQLRVNRAFPPMSAAIDLYERQLDDLAATGAPMALGAGMSHLTADIICRTIFSRPLAADVTASVFHDFAAFERSVANVEIRRLLLARPFADIPQPARVRAACARIRGHIGALLDPRLAPGAAAIDDIVGAVIATRDPETGEGFTREELIDQIGVFFLAGHETTASVLTWTFFMLSQQPRIVARLRAEIATVAGDGPITLEHVKHLVFVRHVFREALRLYPPITFIPRVALVDTEIDGRKVKRGTMIMIAPWAIHRHEALWANADRFDPDRFAGEREQAPGAYLPFGLGPRVCVGAAFATIESALILARLVRRYDFTPEAPQTVRPVARLTTKPAREIVCHIRRTGVSALPASC
jgi:cytochrome P450